MQLIWGGVSLDNDPIIIQQEGITFTVLNTTITIDLAMASRTAILSNEWKIIISHIDLETTTVYQTINLQ